jgi:hypothetical protein
LQRLKLALACKHSLDVTAVLEYQGRPYRPDFVGKPVRCKMCRTVQNVVSQDPPFKPEALPAEQAGPILVSALMGK